MSVLSCGDCGAESGPCPGTVRNPEGCNWFPKENFHYIDCGIAGGFPHPASAHLPERANREGDSQPLPTVNDKPFVQDAVINDIESRKKIGIKRYGTPLQPFNGRDALLDAYEEALDLAIYLKQAIIERDSNVG